MWKLDRVLSIILEIGCRLQKGKKNSFRIKKMLFTKKLRYKVLKIKITGEMNKEGIAKKIGSILLYLMKNFRKKD